MSGTLDEEMRDKTQAAPGQDTGTASRARALLRRDVPVVPGQNSRDESGTHGGGTRDTSAPLCSAAASRSEQQRERLKRDPRFAAWAAGATPAAVEAVLGQDMYPDVAAMHEERRELFRLRAQAIVDGVENGSKAMDDERLLQWAQQVVRTTKPLARALSDGGAK